MESEIRKAIEFNNEMSEKAQPTDGERFRLNRYGAELYFTHFQKWREEIGSYFNEVKAQGDKVTYVDVCGRANGRKLGADISYCFSLQTPRSADWFHDEEDVLMEGDIFSAKDFYGFVSRIKEDGNQPSLVTFEPVAGLQDYSPGGQSKPTLHREVTYQRLENNLKKMIEIVRPGGYIFLGKAFQLDDLGDFFARKKPEEYTTSLNIKRIAKETKCSLRIQGDIEGPYFLLRKHKTRTKK